MATAKDVAFKSVSATDANLNFFSTKRIVKRDVPFFCAKEIQELIESIRILRDDIRNLTKSSTNLEIEGLSLQKQMLTSEKGQTQLIRDLLAFHPITRIEIGLTVLVLLLHLPELLKGMQTAKDWCDTLIGRVKKSRHASKPESVANDYELPSVATLKVEASSEEAKIAYQRLC